jgi:hypothetical protein
VILNRKLRIVEYPPKKPLLIVCSDMLSTDLNPKKSHHTAKKEMTKARFNNNRQKLMNTTHSIQRVPFRFGGYAIQRSSVKYREHNSGGFSDRIEWILDMGLDFFSSFHQVPITKYSHIQLLWIKRNRQF